MQKKPVLAPQFLRELADNNPIGIELEPADVQAWFDLIWLKYSTYNYRNHKRAIARWWSRVREWEIDRARERVARMQDEAETARLERIAQRRDIPQESGTVVDIRDHFSKLGAR